jgi:membrane protease YdiL (CAAX protease family)
MVKWWSTIFAVAGGALAGGAIMYSRGIWLALIAYAVGNGGVVKNDGSSGDE